jgi:hypothetical protein
MKEKDASTSEKENQKQELLKILLIFASEF